VAFGVAFTVLDVAEVAHQLAESSASIAALAGVIAATHLAAAAASGVVLRAPEPA
jgi:hypothetical protein